MSKTIVGVLVALPKSWTTDQGAAVVQWVRDHVRAAGTASGLVVVPNVLTTHQEYHRHYIDGMPLDQWVRDTLDRRSPALQRRRYDMVIIPGQTCGKTTALLVDKALAHPRLGKKVRAMVRRKGRMTLQPVRSIEVLNTQDWVAGWQLVLSSPSSKE